MMRIRKFRVKRDVQIRINFSSLLARILTFTRFTSDRNERHNKIVRFQCALIIIFSAEIKRRAINSINERGWHANGGPSPSTFSYFKVVESGTMKLVKTGPRPRHL